MPMPGRRTARRPPARPPSRSKISRSSPATWSACTPPPRMRAPRQNTDMYFIEAQPFETQLHAVAAGRRRWRRRRRRGDEQNQISQRQKEIIAATWNQVKGTGRQGHRLRERRLPGRRAVQAARPGEVAGRSHEGAPVDRRGRFLQELRQGHGEGRRGDGSGGREVEGRQVAGCAGAGAEGAAVS